MSNAPPTPLPVVAPDTEGPTWIVVAAYNEAQRLGTTLKALAASYRHIVVVDDGSQDETAAVARGHGVAVLRHLVNRGQGAALQTGILFALRQGAGAVVTFDADGQHSPADIARLLQPVLANEADVALGSRFLGETHGLPHSRWLTLKLGVLFTRLTSQLPVTDTHNGLRALSRHAAQRIRITQDRMAHASEILDEVRRHGLRYREVPVTIHYTAGTLAKGQSSWAAFRILGQILISRVLR